MGNELCEGCHLAGEVVVHGNEVKLADGYVLYSNRARALKVVDLDADRQRNHPIPNHPVTGTITPERGSDIPKTLEGTQMTCLSCHVPHTAASRQLFAYGAESRAELCTACHPK
jgi:predicted CXXCH cytochrome family protein